MLEERNRLYEILIRINEDGTSAAHVHSISEVVKDGAVIAATVGIPKPLEVHSAEMSALLGEAVVSAYATAKAAESAREDAQKELASAQMLIERLQLEIRSIRG